MDTLPPKKSVIRNAYRLREQIRTSTQKQSPVLKTLNNKICIIQYIFALMLHIFHKG
jgi:hypothetical protein